MSAPDVAPARDTFVSQALEITIRVGLVLLLVAWCFNIVRPFIAPVLWGVIIAIATRGFYATIERWVGGRRALAAMVFGLAGLVLIIGPILALTTTVVESVGQAGAALSDGKLRVPPPPKTVVGWPFVGEPVNRFWSLASVNLEEALSVAEPQLRQAALWVIGVVTSTGVGVLLFSLSIIVAAVLHTQAKGAQKFAYAIAARLAGPRGPSLADLAEATIRGVTRGILGVALIQALAAGLGMVVAGVPAAGLWSLLVMLVCVIQLPSLLVLLPIAIWVFTMASTPIAVAFLIWSVLVGLLDNVLKPILLSRGVDVPMVVVFVGAIGGFASTGIIGLFVGSIVLAVSYKLFEAWLEDGQTPA